MLTVYNMAFVYIIVENGDTYPCAFKTYESAIQAVNNKHKEELERQIEEMPDMKEEILGDVNPIENPNGKTSLYIEKGIHIDICKLTFAWKRID